MEACTLLRLWHTKQQKVRDTRANLLQKLKTISLKEAALTYYQENLEIIRFHGAKTVKQTDMKFNIQQKKILQRVKL